MVNKSHTNYRRKKNLTFEAPFSCHQKIPFFCPCNHLYKPSIVTIPYLVVIFWTFHKSMKKPRTIVTDTIMKCFFRHK